MERLMYNRKPKRAQSTKIINGIKDILERDQEDWVQIYSRFELLEEVHRQLDELDNQIFNAMFDANTEDDEQAKEADDCNRYKLNFLMLKRQIQALKEMRTPAINDLDIVNDMDNISNRSIPTNNVRRNVKYPKIELRKFSGDLTDWLPFWSQFKKTHEDESLYETDKMHFLMQSMEKGTEAYDLVNSYPQTAGNYQKVVAALRRRYGNKDLLLQVYIRELLKLVISNSNAKEKLSMEMLYLKLDSHLRSLKSLELEQADPASWLFPLVESSLPEDTLITWQRSSLCTKDGSIENPQKSRLDYMMEFLAKEVEIRQRVVLAQDGFNKQEKIVGRSDRKEKKLEFPSLAAFTANDSKGCVFCEKNHLSQECFKAQKMSLEDKQKILKNKRCCYICFSDKHISNKCKSFVKCFICSKRHYTIMCQSYSANDEGKEKNIANTKQEGRNDKTEILSGFTSHLTNTNSCSREVPLQTLMVLIHGSKKSKLVRAMYDGGSQRSHILTRLAKELGLSPKRSERVSHSLFGGGQTTPVDENVYHVTLQKQGGGYQCFLGVRGRDLICNKIPRVSRRKKELFSALKRNSVYLSDVGEDFPEIELLLGNEVMGKLLTGGKVDLTEQMTALETKLGWILSGTFAEMKEDSTTTLFTLSVNEMSVTQLWDLDTIGVRDPVEVKTKNEEKVAVTKKLISTLTRSSNGRYCVSLPWKDGHPPLPRNMEVAKSRLNRAVNKLEENSMFEIYDKLFLDWINQDFIEKVPMEELSRESHVLPHRPVIKLESSTTPVRPVFDASCKIGCHPSLNDCLEKGNNMIQLIPEILLRFRERAVAFTSDIKKAFQMIDVNKKDQDYMRFLWYEKGRNSQVVEFRHRRVMFGATCSPFILAAILEHHLKNVNSEVKFVADKLLESMYVDNCVTSVDSLNEYLSFKEKSIKIFADAQMDLRLWMSNQDKEIDSSSEEVSVLGLMWNRKRDTLSIHMPQLRVEKVTKRNILSTIQKVFDPIGFTAPTLVPMKILLQGAWIAKINWDETLPEDTVNKFLSWVEELRILKEIHIPRMVTGGVEDRSQWSLHLCTDASFYCYSAVVFLRTKGQECVHVHLLGARVRMAPLKKMTIPRLELLGCLIGSRLLLSIRQSLRLTGVQEYCWTDSTTALAWIKRQDNWGTFVGNRVTEIRRNSDVQSWRHIPGSLNPADLPSRGCSPQDLERSKWWEGPSWLKLTPKDWPKMGVETNDDEILAEKRKTVEKKLMMVNVEYVRCDRSYRQLIRIQAYVIRACQIMRKKKISGPLSIQELKKAELQILKEIQEETIGINVGEIAAGFPIIKDEEGIWRVKTRIIERDDTVDFRYPILLPRQHNLVMKIIRDAHQLYSHAGVQFLMGKLREKYYIVKSRQIIKKVLSSCVVCRRYSSKPLIVEIAPLPLDRVKDSNVFQTTGVDLAGPIRLKGGQKMWIAIFTCAVYRAVCLETVNSLDTKTFLQVLRKFVRMHGRPEVIYSDNGTNFVGAANNFKKIDWKIIQEDIKEIIWKFNPPTAAWWGGWWERLIRSIKDLMRRMVGKGTLTKTELQEVLLTLEEVMNNRPLTYVSDDPNDLQPLTPALFLRPCGGVAFPEIDGSEAEKMRHRYKCLQALKKDIKMRFRREYLSQLVNKPRGRPSRPLQVDEIVIVERDDSKRLMWPLGRIVELIPGNDGKSRVARVRVQDGELIRPVRRLYPLEVSNYREEEKATGKILRGKYGRVMDFNDRENNI